MKNSTRSVLFLGISSFSILLNAVCSLGALTQVSGSPFTTGFGPFSVAYSPLVSGNLFMAVANSTSNNVSVYTVNAITGVLTAVSGSPFATGSAAFDVAYSPLVYGNLFAAVTNNASASVSVYTVNTTTGVLTAVSGSPFATGLGSYGIAYSPLINGNLFAAVTNSTDNTVSVYTVNTTTGAFTSVSGSPFATGSFPVEVTFSPLVSGNLFAAVANNNSNNVSVYQVNISTGVFTPVSGAPFAIGQFGASGVAFSPLISSQGLFAAVANNGSASVSVYTVNTTTGVFTQVAGSPFATGIAGSRPIGVAFSPLIASQELFAQVANNLNGSNSVSVYTVNTTTGAFTAVTGSPFATGTKPNNVAFSPLTASQRFFSAVTNNTDNTVSVFQVTTLVPTITTLSQFILSGGSVTLNATIIGGTSPYTVVWQDLVSQGPTTSPVTRIVTPSSTTVYYITTVTDANGCVAGPSNAIAIGVRTCP